MAQFTVSSHFLSQAYMRPWSNDGHRIMAYRLLVPHEGYPTWELRSIRSLGVFPHLYTSVAGGEPSDELERWFNVTIEAPAAPVVEKVRRDERLTQGDWERLAWFLAALDLRTPWSYMDHMAYCAEALPRLLKQTLGTLEHRLKRAKRVKTLTSPPTDGALADRFPMKVRVDKEPSAGRVAVRAEVTLGRELWLHNIRTLLTTTAPVLTGHKWVILRPYPGWQWYTSDQPVLRLNYGPDEYNFGGGWGSKGTELMLPLSPVHLMYTQVGERRHTSRTLSPEETSDLQRLTAQHARRWIIARDEARRAEWFHPRCVDQDLFRREEETIKQWHTLQTTAEANLVAESPSTI